MLDTYDYAVQAEWLGVGVWGNRRHAPLVNEEELTYAILSVIGITMVDGLSVVRRVRAPRGSLGQAMMLLLSISFGRCVR